jgi:hypothetical protein
MFENRPNHRDGCRAIYGNTKHTVWAAIQFLFDLDVGEYNRPRLRMSNQDCATSANNVKKRLPIQPPAHEKQHRKRQRNANNMPTTREDAPGEASSLVVSTS